MKKIVRDSEQAQKGITYKFEGELNEDESIEFENHLLACQECQMEIASIKKCIDMMKNVFSEKKPPSEIKKIVLEKALCDEKERSLCCPPDDEN